MQMGDSSCHSSQLPKGAESARLESSQAGTPTLLAQSSSRQVLRPVLWDPQGVFRKQTLTWFQPAGSTGSGCDQSYRNPHLHLTGRAQAQETQNHPRQPQNGQRNLGNKLPCRQRQCLQIPRPAGSPSPAPIKPQATQKTRSMGSEGQMHGLGLKLGPVTCVLCDLGKVTSPL